MNETERMQRIEHLMQLDPPADSPEGDELLRLAIRQENHEKQQFPEFTRPSTTAMTVQRYADEYIESYELYGEDAEGREGSYSPNEQELMLITDAINGLIASDDFLDLMAAHHADRQARRKAEGCCPGCGAPIGTHWGIRPGCLSVEATGDNKCSD